MPVDSLARFRAALIGLLLCIPAAAQENTPVTLRLFLEGSGAHYKIGEPVGLDLTFTAVEPGYSLNITTTAPSSPVDTLVLEPAAGTFPWLADQARGDRYTPDYAAMAPLEIGKAVTVKLPLNAVYRFDQPGHYEVHVVTKRVVRGQATLAPMTSNTIAFDIAAMSDAEEAQRAAALEKNIRSAPGLRPAQVYSEELAWLTGDASTRVKLSLFLRPKTFYPFGVDVTPGLWVARNRALVVAELEKALDDPAQPFPAGTSFLPTAAALKARWIVPFDPAAPAAALPDREIERDYVKRLARSLPKRQGKALVDAARTVFVELAQWKETSEPEFAAAREILIAHFAEVNEFNVDWLLDTYGRYFDDARMVAPLRQILATQQNSTFLEERTAALNQLLRIAPAESRKDLIQEVCDKNATLLQSLTKVPFETLPETDDCLKGKLVSAAAGSRNRLELQWAAEFIARFATPSIYADLLNLYLKSGPSWDKAAQAYLLAYFVRWDARRGLPLLETALPLSAGTVDQEMTYALDRAYSPPLLTFWRKRLGIAPSEQARAVAWQLSQHGTLDDRARLNARLKRWRSEWAGREIPTSEGLLEAELVDALLHGKNWQTPESEAAALRQSCLSASCIERNAARR